jgi:hypothetical protein
MIVDRRLPVRIEGLPELRKKIRGITDDLDRDGAKGALKDLNLDAAKVVEGKAAAIIPRRTGKLASTLRAAGTQRSARVRAGYRRQGFTYAGPIHFGWYAQGIRPQPFLYDALDARRNQVLEVYDAGIDRLIKQYGLD